MAKSRMKKLIELNLAYPKLTAANRSELHKGRRILPTARRAR